MTHDRGLLLLALLVLLAMASNDEESPPTRRSPRPRATAQPSGVWSEETMRLFVREMAAVPIDPDIVLLAIAAASRFDPSAEIGANAGLLLVERDDLERVGVPIPEAFGELDAEGQIPWIAKVIAHRLAGARAPTSVPDLAVLLHPFDSPTVQDVIRKEAARRVREAEGTPLYLAQSRLLQRVRE